METKLTPADIESRLAHHSGSGEFYSMGPLFKDFIHTEGIADMAELCGAHWLYEAIASHIMTNPKLREGSSILFWRLKVTPEEQTLEGRLGRHALLYCFPDIDDDGNDLPATVSQDIEYTDFPLDEIQIWAGRNAPGLGWTIYLPSEH